MGTLWYQLVPIRRRVVREQLKLAFPEFDGKQIRDISAAVFRNLATTVLEILWLGRADSRQITDLVEIRGLENYEKLRAQGRGVIAITAHMGNWDLVACTQALSGVPLNVVTKTLKTRGFSNTWMESRQRSGVRLLGMRGSALALVRALRKGEVVGLVVDQRTSIEEGGAAIPFFGRPALTTLAPHQLARRTNAALLPVWSFRCNKGNHVLVIDEELPLGATSEETMALVNEKVESWIRKKPEQWLWLHRRWKH